MMRGVGLIFFLSVLASSGAVPEPYPASSAAEGRDGLIHIWDGTSYHRHSVTLEPFLPEENLYGASVIVCPGGSYCWLDYDTEGIQVACWLQGQGVSAYVLKYSVMGKFQFGSLAGLYAPTRKHPDMICDMQRAVQVVREIDSTCCVGAIGFSAGGHLVMSAAEFFRSDFPALKGVSSSVSRRPDFVAAIYPVVTMSGKVTHRRSRRALLGEYRSGNRKLRDSLSLEKHVPADCPPVFLLNCRDDNVVDFRNSELLDSALTVAAVPHKYIQYETGRHGFGASASKGTAESRQWMDAFMEWFRETVSNLKK
ncbi:MAG: alpha/beta hydrolase [Candidatus Cryptobacteroides sp.]